MVLADRRTGALRGRDETLDQLGVALLQASSGHATVMLVEGQPGSGKTALCAHVVTTASDRLFRVVRLAPVEGEFDLPLAGLSALLRPLLKYSGGLSAAQQRAVRAMTGLSDDAVHDRFTLGAATLGLLSAAVEQAPLDPVSGDALSFAFRRLAVGDLA